MRKMKKMNLFTIRNNINKALILTVLGMAFINLLDFKIVFGEDKPKLRWEYKYQEGEVLMYLAKGKDIAQSGMVEGYEREIEGVLGIEVGKDMEKGFKKGKTWTKVKKIDDEDMMYQKSSTYGEGILGDIELNRDGTVEGLGYGNVFFLGLPRFVESELDLWNKEIELNEQLGQEKGVRIKLTGYYMKLVGEEIVKGRNCIIISTEIGGKVQGTDQERGEFTRTDGLNKLRVQLYAKSWFSPEEGRVIKMDSELKIFDYSEIDLYNRAESMRRIVEESKMLFKTESERAEALKSLEEGMKEMERTGKRKVKVFGDKEAINRHFMYELLDEKDIKKLDGIEDEWELVLSGVNNFQLTENGKIVYVREAPIRNDEPMGIGSTSNGVKTTSYLYICDGDGSNQRRLTEGMKPVVSPDGKWVVFEIDKGKKMFKNPEGEEYVGRDIEQKVIDMEGKEIKDLLKTIDVLPSAFSGSSWKFNKNNYDINPRPCNRSWNDEKNKLVFTDKTIIDEETKFFMFDINDKKTIELKELVNIGIIRFDLSPKELILAYKSNKSHETNYGLIYFSEDGKILKKIVLKIKSGYFYWSTDGNYLIYFTSAGSTNIEHKIYIYSLRSEKFIWESPWFVLDWRLSKDFKYIYFTKYGNISVKVGLYRIPTPKDLQEKIERGE